MARPPIPSGERCYHCGSLETCKAGMVGGKKRFRCQRCRKFSREDAILPDGGSNYRDQVKYNLPTAAQLILELQSLAQSVLWRTPTTDDINLLSKQGRSQSLATYYAVFWELRNRDPASQVQTALPSAV